MAKLKSGKNRRRRARKRVPGRLAGLKKKVERGSLWGKEIVVEPRGEAKMSEVLTDFVEPYLESADTRQDHQKLLMIAIVAWNTALLPEEKQQGVIDELVDQSLPKDADSLRTNMKQVVSELITRKKRYFSEYKRVIIDFELKDRGDSYYLSVASTLEGKTTDPESG